MLIITNTTVPTLEARITDEDSSYVVKIVEMEAKQSMNPFVRNLLTCHHVCRMRSRTCAIEHAVEILDDYVFQLTGKRTPNRQLSTNTEQRV